MRVLIYNWRDLDHPHAGGAEVYVHEVARAWVREGHEVTIFSSRAGSLPPTSSRDGVAIVRRGRRFTVYREARRFWSAEGAGRFDVVVDAVNTRPFMTPTYVTDTPVVALIFQIAGDIWNHHFTWPIAAIGRHWLEPRWLRAYQNTLVLTISESSRASLVDLGLRDIRIVPVGSPPPPSSLPAKESRSTVVFLGRLAQNKRPADAIAAFEFAAARLDLQLWVLGTGPLEQQLRKRSPSGVTFFGRVSDDEKMDLLARAHVLVATSVREGWGMCVTEAASVGTPAITYDVPGLRESVAAAAGQLVPVGPRHLGEALVEHFTLPRSTPDLRSPPSSWQDVADAIGCQVRLVRDLAVKARD